MKTTRIMIAASLALASLVVPATAATANPVDCNATAIWTQDLNGLVKKWSKSGTLLGTVQGIPPSNDIAISSNLGEILVVGSNTISSYSATTGALIGQPRTFTGVSSNDPTGSGLISGGRLLINNDPQIFSVDTTTLVGSVFAVLTDADLSLPAGNTGGGWSIAGDLLQLPDGDILAITNNSEFEVSLLVRITATAPRQLTVVGTVASSDIYGAARAGDEVYLATGSGELLRLGPIPSSASLNPVAFTALTLDGSNDVFYGAAGSNDSTEGATGCTFANPVPAAAPAAAPAPAAAAPAPAPVLAKTGADSWSAAGLSLAALALVGFGVARIASRRTKKA